MCLLVNVIYVVELLLGFESIIVTKNPQFEYLLLHLTQHDIVTKMSKTMWWISLFDRPIRVRNEH